MKNQVEFMVRLIRTNHINPCLHVVATLVSKRDPKIAESRKCLGKIQIFLAQNPIFLAWNPIVFTRKLIFLNGFMSFLNGFLRFFDGFPTFTFGFLLSATPFYFPQRFAAFRKGFLIFLKGFPIFLDGVICLAGVRLLLQPEKSSSRLSGGCAIVITTGKKKI